MNLNEIDFKKLYLQNIFIQFFIAACLAIALVVVGYFLIFQGQWESYQSNVAKEVELKEEYERKSIQAANLDNLKQELVDLEASIAVLLKQLPTTAEVPTLLQELHQAAAKNGLTMSSVIQRPPVSEKPIERLPFSISVVGRYEQIAQFARDVGQMSRIVTLSNITFEIPSNSNKENVGKLMFSAVANTYKAMEASDEQKIASAASAVGMEGKSK
ncbi:type 4a pilus biogenesis protein PilO [Wielerella bovis]|uniref:type 4a pilus biogenesis protein PilO n=1 Tax=Wielerella bovis TaxID=2917790 RepID=UPI002018F95E|nr:type 4a pilus biogenesis protein PilO [Wielerella bovis]MCG7656833.1 type 4a pilus biogenesis protein PilO [Wielerella bovis]MCG7659056.1 type 4a pilus biogenesis protein PilO [Wielerella bovis]